MNEVLSILQSNLEAVKAAISTDDGRGYILAWDNGIGVRFVDHKPRPCTVEHATVVATQDMPEDAWAWTPNVVDGHGRRASVIRRRDALQREADALAELIEKSGPKPSDPMDDVNYVGHPCHY